jgi:hypothetical protein
MADGYEATEETREDRLAAVSEALLVQHLQSSWPLPNQRASWFGDGPRPERYGESIRTVAVVGAGASLPILSLADDLAKELESDLGKYDIEERGEYLDKLEDIYGLRRTAFETRLMALCRTPEGEQAVREVIGAKYRHRHPTLLTYELLAHLLHHRFLDTIISFNFDELLDQSIEDELGPNEFTRVVSERDFEPGEEVKGPLYVKLHGTATEPDSLRFTKERYFTIPKSIASLVERRFDVEHLVVLNLGFSMVNDDFQYLLRKPKEVEIFNLDPRPVSAAVREDITRRRRPERQRKDIERSEAFDAPAIFELAGEAGGAEDPYMLGGLLNDVTQSLELTCNSPMAGPACWRSTQRHLAMVRLLKEYDNSNEKHQAEYLRRRAVLEIAFAAAKGRGVVSIASMVDDRCGRYYDLYAQKAESPDDWPKVCWDGGLVESLPAPDTYEILPEVRAAAGVGGDIHQLHLADPEKLARHTARSLGISKRDRHELIELLTETLQILQVDTEIEVHSRDDRVCSKIFANAPVLTTLTALRGWTRELLLRTHNYNELWVVAETGEWLAEDDVATILGTRCTRVKLLRAFEADGAPSGGIFSLRKLPWGRHNRHMTILCDSGEPRAAIYFARRLRAATVTPVHLSHARDLERMSRAFAQLWKEAKIYESEQKTA